MAFSRPVLSATHNFVTGQKTVLAVIILIPALLLTILTGCNQSSDTSRNLKSVIEQYPDSALRSNDTGSDE